MGGGYHNDPLTLISSHDVKRPFAQRLTRLYLQWGSAMVIVPLRLYQYYYDIRFLKFKR